MNAGLVPETSLGEAPTVDQISTDTRHERHVHFPTNDYEEDRQIHLNLRSPPPPYEAKDDFLEELRLDLAIAEEGIWRLEWELVLLQDRRRIVPGTDIPCPASPPPPPYSSLGDCSGWGDADIIELQLDLLIARERIHILMWQLNGYYTLLG
ncbi:hypothetical protein B0H14DRAFT_3576062 [Mycena olivaceomarginata]|nr:hypothetical protein B0H14DRAFT_3576062 [Mycena olivaceomarginata]